MILSVPIATREKCTTNVVRGDMDASLAAPPDWHEAWELLNAVKGWSILSSIMDPEVRGKASCLESMFSCVCWWLLFFTS